MCRWRRWIEETATTLGLFQRALRGLAEWPRRLAPASCAPKRRADVGGKKRGWEIKAREPCDRADGGAEAGVRRGTRRGARRVLEGGRWKGARREQGWAGAFGGAGIDCAFAGEIGFPGRGFGRQRVYEDGGVLGAGGERYRGGGAPAARPWRPILRGSRAA